MKGQRVFIFTAVLFLCALVHAQSHSGETVSLSYLGGRNYVLVERTDLLRYDNGQFTGLLSREVHSYVVDRGADGDGAHLYDGNFYVVEETKRDRKRVREGIHTAIDSSFKITKEGSLLMMEDNGYPSFRSFPSYTKTKIQIGDKWIAQAERAVDPLNNGTVTRMPILVEYTYVRDDVYNGEDVYILGAKWATRYGSSSSAAFDPDGDAALLKADGSHNATIIISKKLGNALVIRDTVDETFVYEGGQTVRLKGTIALFTRYPPAYSSSTVIAAAATAGTAGTASAAGTASGGTGGVSAGDGIALGRDTTIIEGADGVKLVMRNLQFKSDSAQLLPGQEARLDTIARILKAAPESQYLVEGHTAETGNPEGEKKLSLERARAVAEALAARGVDPGQFICKGWGAMKPASGNDTAEGRAANRRVEITILK